MKWTENDIVFFAPNPDKPEPKRPSTPVFLPIVQGFARLGLSVEIACQFPADRVVALYHTLLLLTRDPAMKKMVQACCYSQVMHIGFSEWVCYDSHRQIT